MNFLLATLLILLFLFPGFVFRASYLNVRHGRSFRSSIVEELLFSLAPSVLIHCMILPLIIIWTNFDIHGFYLLMINNPEAKESMANWDAIKLLLYCLLTLMFGFLMGTGFSWLVRKYNWDLYSSILRIRNEWYYSLAGYTFLYIKNNKVRKVFVEPDLIRIDAVVELNKDAIPRNTRRFRFIKRGWN